MKSIKMLKKQILILFVFSLLASIGAIIHGIYMDLDFAQIKRLTLEGVILTFFVVFPAILFLEWVFDLNNKKIIESLKKEIDELKKN